MPDQPPSEPEKFVPMRPPTPRRYYSEREMREEKKRELARPVVWEESKKGAKKLNRISSVLLGLALTVLGAAAWLVGRSPKSEFPGHGAHFAPWSGNFTAWGQCERYR